MDSKPSITAAGRWLALAAALLGWMFDGAEMGIFSLVGRQAVKELLYPGGAKPDEGEIGLWFNIIIASFLVGAATGGVLFGWLGDRIGRVSAMTLSVLTYAVFTGLCAFCTEAWQIGSLRFIASLGMGGEWSLGVALVMEIWPNRSRAFMAGLIGAAANVGYLMVGVLGILLIDFLQAIRGMMLSGGLSQVTVDWLANTNYGGWRLMMLLGLLPAALTFFIRLFVPESEKWQRERDKQTTQNLASTDLLGVLVGLIGPALIVYVWAWNGFGWLPHTLPVRIAVTAVGLLIAFAGYTFPVVRYFQRRDASRNGAAPEGEATLGRTIYRMLLGATLSGVALLGTWGSTQQAPSWVDKLNETELQTQRKAHEAAGKFEAAKLLQKQKGKEETLIWLSLGAIVGTILAALLGDAIGRRPAYFLLCLLSMGTAWMLFLGNTEYGFPLLMWAFAAGICTASFYGWLPLYLPELFGTSVRATGQGFCFNFGRVLAAIGTLQVGNLIKSITEPVNLGGFIIPAGHPVACSAICFIYVLGMAVIWLCPETRGKPLPD